MLIVSQILFKLVVYRRKVQPGQQTHPPNLHQIPNPRTRKGIPLQQIPDTKTPSGDLPHALSDRTPNQNLVPESADEGEEGHQIRRRLSRDRRREHEPEPGLFEHLSETVL